MYDVICPSCRAQTASPFVRLGAVMQCDHCAAIFRIDRKHVAKHGDVAASSDPSSDKSNDSTAKGASIDLSEDDESSRERLDHDGNVIGLSGLSEIMQRELERAETLQAPQNQQPHAAKVKANSDSDAATSETSTASTTAGRQVPKNQDSLAESSAKTTDSADKPPVNKHAFAALLIGVALLAVIGGVVYFVALNVTSSGDAANQITSNVESVADNTAEDDFLPSAPTVRVNLRTNDALAKPERLTGKPTYWQFENIASDLQDTPSTDAWLDSLTTMPTSSSGTDAPAGQADAYRLADVRAYGFGVIDLAHAVFFVVNQTEPDQGVLAVGRLPVALLNKDRNRKLLVELPAALRENTALRLGPVIVDRWLADGRFIDSDQITIRTVDASSANESSGDPFLRIDIKDTGKETVRRSILLLQAIHPDHEIPLAAWRLEIQRSMTPHQWVRVELPIPSDWSPADDNVIWQVEAAVTSTETESN